jgi:DNA-binding NarL/FixJ family response regulator
VWLSDWFKKRNQERPIREKSLKILALSVFLQDRILLERLGKQYDWELRFTNSPTEAFKWVSQNQFEIILCDRNQPGYPWREVMDCLAKSSPRSCILLISPVNDDYLWNDVLQWGGYDVLRRPLLPEAVLHSIGAAIRFISPVATPCGTRIL